MRGRAQNTQYESEVPTRKSRFTRRYQDIVLLAAGISGRYDDDTDISLLLI